jgi:cation diffusion facilitator CzcD-associated flavoprotein CzcO
MALASDPTPLGLQALEALVGRPLTRAPDPSPRAETDEALRARAMLVAKTAEERRNIALMRGANLDATAAGYGLTRLNASPEQVAKRAEIVRKRRVRDPRVVEWVAPNPRRPGTKAYVAFACWRAGDTVDQCLERGLPARYVGKSVKKGWVKLGAIRK